MDSQMTPRKGAAMWLSSCIERGKREFFATSIELTPALAQELLLRNPANRNITEARVLMYADDIENDRWEFNGQPIIVSDDGLLTDGQHRCEAVALAGKSIRSSIAFGVSYESRKTTDQCKPKGAADFLAMDDVPYAKALTGVARMLVIMERTGNVNQPNGISHANVLEFATRNKDSLLESTAFTHQHLTKLKNVISPIVLAFCHYLFKQISSEAAHTFCSQIIHGEGLAADDPAMAVRNKLISTSKATRAAKTEIVFHGWNAFRRGERRTLIRILGKLPELV